VSRIERDTGGVGQLDLLDLSSIKWVLRIARDTGGVG
jgi:hypothetical protein